jgi:hypothetical protein
MAKRYIIDDIHANNWTVTMRDRETGEIVLVPLELGALWPGKLRGDAANRDSSETPRSGDEVAEAPATATATEPEPPAEKPPAGKKPRKDRGERKGMARVTDPEALKEIMTSPVLRSQDVDEETIAPDDMAALRTMQSMMRRAKGRRAGKLGELGWDETTDAGRSGLISRFGKGAFKILHAGGDTYALFFEWDDGRYDRLGCGAAEAMMELANQRAQDEPPEPPPSHLSLELARFHCGTPAQKDSANERLEPAFAEAQRNTPGAAPRISETEVNERLGRSTEREVAKFEARKAKERKRDAEQPPAPTAPNAEMDNQLSESLKRALADLDAQEATARKE